MYKKKVTTEEIFVLALQNHQKNNLQVAENLYNEVLKMNSYHFESIFLLGSLSILKKDFNKAKKLLNQAIQIQSNHAVVYNNLGNVLKELEEDDKAIIFYEKAIEIQANNVEAYNNLGLVFCKLEKYQNAKNCYEKVIQIQPHNTVAQHNLDLLLRKLRGFEETKVLYEKLIQITSNHLDVYNKLGLIYYESKELEKAISCYEKAIQVNPNHVDAYNNLGLVFYELKKYKKAISFHKKAQKLRPDLIDIQASISEAYNSQLDNLKEAVNSSHKTLRMCQEKSKFTNQRISLYRLKHDVQQAEYLSSKNYKIDGINMFQKIGNEILERKENRENNDNYNQKILLNSFEINSLLPFYKAHYIYQTQKVSGGHINPNNDWRNIEELFLKSPKQITYIDDFLSDVAIRELREFCLVSKIWNREYKDKYLSSFSASGFNSPVHLQIAIDLKQKLPKLFGQHSLGKFWGFKYDTTLGKGINVHADFALYNLNFWITPDKYNNEKNSGGLKIYDVPLPENWTFQQYNIKADKIYKFINDNKGKCTNIPYKFNRAVLFNSAYFHETDQINFKEGYKGRRINVTYLFGK